MVPSKYRWRDDFSQSFLILKAYILMTQFTHELRRLERIEWQRAATFPAFMQRAKLKAFNQLIDGNRSALCRAPDGTWAIRGNGWAYLRSARWVSLAVKSSMMLWHSARSSLSAFCEVTHSEAAGGVLSLNLLPSSLEGAVIRKSLGIARASIPKNKPRPTDSEGPATSATPIPKNARRPFTRQWLEAAE
jgi:hypothetical protein